MTDADIWETVRVLRAVGLGDVYGTDAGTVKVIVRAPSIGATIVRTFSARLDADGARLAKIEIDAEIKAERKSFRDRTRAWRDASRS